MVIFYGQYRVPRVLGVGCHAEKACRMAWKDLIFFNIAAFYFVFFIFASIRVSHEITRCQAETSAV
jgi:hypothetical protein